MVGFGRTLKGSWSNQGQAAEDSKEMGFLPETDRFMVPSRAVRRDKEVGSWSEMDRFLVQYGQAGELRG